MKFFTTRKKMAATVASVALAASLGGVAYAYFTSTGHGTGSASVGLAKNWTVGESGTPSGGALYPDAAIGGANIQTDTYTVTNAGSGSQNLTSVAISVANGDGTTWSSQTNLTDPACTAADFSVGGKATGATDTDVSQAGDFTAGQSKNTTVSVELIDNGLNQDNCQGLTVPLYFFAS